MDCSFFKATVCVALLAQAATGAPPELKHLYPAAGQQRTNSLVSIGKADPPPHLWSSNPGVKFTPTPLLGTYNVEIAADAAPGPHLVRAVNGEGASAPRFFIVSREPELRDAEPNDDAGKPQAIAALPATISGRLDKNGDVDGYALTLKQGQTLVAWVEAYVLASTFDGLLRITDVAGRVLAFNHDGRNLDPLLAWTAPQDGTFIVQLMGFAHPPQSSVQFTGGEGCVYRLHLTTGPVIRFFAPMMARAGEKTPVHLMGWNLPNSQGEVDGTQLTAGSSVSASPIPGTVCLQPVSVSEVREGVEEDAAARSPQVLEVPGAITGRIRAAGEQDHYTFTAVKGRAYEIKVTGAQVGSPLDAWLSLRDAEGKELVRNDDAGSRDPKLLWSAPTDGIFTAVIGDVTHRGGDDFLYRLAITEAAPSVNASTTSHAVVVAPGKTAEVKVTVKREHGFKSKLELAATDLPAGVTAASVEVPEKDGDMTIKLAAEETATLAGQVFRLVLREKEGGREHPVRHHLVATSENNGVPQGYAELVINETDQIFVTVTVTVAEKAK